MLSELATLIDRHCIGAHAPCELPRVRLSRVAATAARQEYLYEPRVYFVAQGAKRIWLGRQELRYDADTYLIVATDLPVAAQVLEGPCLGVSLTFDPLEVADLAKRMSPIARASRSPEPPSASVASLSDDLRDALVRLMRLLDRPERIPILGPLAEREVLYHLFTDETVGAIERLARPTSRFSSIGRVIDEIRRRYDEVIRVDDLARVAAMSPATLHRHFRAVTSMSPLQYQKRIRLHEARRILRSHDVAAASASYEVGYASPTQFSREYKRMFGRSPKDDAMANDDPPTTLDVRRRYRAGADGTNAASV